MSATAGGLTWAQKMRNHFRHWARVERCVAASILTGGARYRSGAPILLPNAPWCQPGGFWLGHMLSGPRWSVGVDGRSRHDVDDPQARALKIIDEIGDSQLFVANNAYFAKRIPHGRPYTG